MSAYPPKKTSHERRKIQAGVIESFGTLAAIPCAYCNRNSYLCIIMSGHRRCANCTKKGRSHCDAVSLGALGEQVGSKERYLVAIEEEQAALQAELVRKRRELMLLKPKLLQSALRKINTEGEHPKNVLNQEEDVLQVQADMRGLSGELFRVESNNI
ncbi:hypothetical protein TWF694_004392 [Orbilia ellipsospora]|uniref:Zn(2)-C6 fungal-type domain-containing protein n=1 Tax=Orbilia ellipsospora TaxID=2528407 RepID=A0AAV9WXJ4_9PEZI